MSVEKLVVMRAEKMVVVMGTVKAVPWVEKSALSTVGKLVVSTVL